MTAWIQQTGEAHALAKNQARAAGVKKRLCSWDDDVDD